MRYIVEKIIPNYPAGAKKDPYQPTLYGYLLDQSPDLKDSDCRRAVIVCPGGSYVFTSDREADPVAMRFLAAGMHAFVLRYSVAPNQFPASLLELAEAVALVRDHAQEWNIDPQQIMICGFSAGGHLCASLGTLWKDPVIGNAMEGRISAGSPQAGGKEAPWRPNGMILSYPVISMTLFAHEESRQMLLGDQNCEELAEKLSLQNRVTEDTVPTFLWTTQEDELVPVENTLLFAAALQRHHVPLELHLYEKGIHGLSLCDVTTENTADQIVPDNTGWMDAAIRWLRRR